MKRLMKIEEVYTNNDGMYCESEVAIMKIAPVHKGGKGLDHFNHEEFVIGFATPTVNGRNPEDNPDEFDKRGLVSPSGLECLKLSRRNMTALRDMLNSIDGLDCDISDKVTFNCEDSE